MKISTSKTDNQILKKLFFLLLLLSTNFMLMAQSKSKTTAKPKPVSAADKTSIANGLIIYSQNCITCHQENGAGLPGMNPPLIKTPWVLGDQTRLIKIVLNGFKEKIEVNGESYESVMPGLNYLKDQEIADVLTYVRNSFGNKASAISLKQVVATRAANSK